MITPAILAGCLGSDEFSTRSLPADFGTPILQADCQTVARDFMAARDQGFETAVYKFGNCLPETLPMSAENGFPEQSGYAMRFAVDLAAEDGTLSGFQNYEVLIYDGHVVRAIRQDRATNEWARL